MDNARDIRLELEAILANNPGETFLQVTIEQLFKLEQELSKSSPSKSTWTTLDSELKHLEDQGLWGTAPEQKHLWNSLSEAMNHPDARTGPDISITMPPSSHGIRAVQAPTLPAELLEQINEVYLLHSLATNPSRMLPPGKSLLSLLSSRTRRPDETGSQKMKALEDQVGEVVTRVFWDEVPCPLPLCPSKLKSSWSALAGAGVAVFTDACRAVDPVTPALH
jgi:hypothetical protein